MKNWIGRCLRAKDLIVKHCTQVIRKKEATTKDNIKTNNKYEATKRMTQDRMNRYNGN